METKPKLSIIILTYNTKDLTLQAIKSVEQNYPNEVKTGEYEIIVADNKSTDKTIDTLNEYKKATSIKAFHIVENEGNIGFSAGNNKGAALARGKYVLFLNPDTIVYKDTLNYVFNFMENHPDVGAASCKLINQDGEIDFNCHRGFPTPWNAFCYFSGLYKIFPKSRLFSGYTQGWKNLSTNHEVDAIEGAFMMVPRSMGEKIGWWDEDYFFYGEDLQFCYNIKKLRLKVFYLGEISILHIGGAASGIKKKTQNITTANIDTKKLLQKHRFNSMRIFFKKNYRQKYPQFLYWFIDRGIGFLEKRALASLKLS